MTRSLALAFQCKAFGYDDDPPSGDPLLRSYLTESLDVQCSSSQHQHIINRAVTFVIIWPFGLPLLYAFLLYRCRRAILDHQPSELSRATRFLWSEYEAKFLWYEMFELSKKLVLTNAILFVDFEQGSTKFLRLIIALVIAILSLTMQLITQPCTPLPAFSRPLALAPCLTSACGERQTASIRTTGSVSWPSGIVERANGVQHAR